MGYSDFIKILPELVYTACNSNAYAYNKFAFEFRKMNNISGLKYIPEFIADEITLENGVVSVGSIVRRPLDGRIKSKIEYHYGVVMGKTKKGRELILDMTTGENISFREKDQFLGSYDLKDLEVFIPAKNITRDAILNRAKNIQYELYSLLDLNCKQFALYVVHSIKPEIRSKYLREFSDSLNDISRGILLMQKCDPLNAGYMEDINRRLNLLELQKQKSLVNSH